jgi:hypothetical protein
MEEFFTNLSGVLDRLSSDLTALDDCEAELETHILFYFMLPQNHSKKIFSFPGRQLQLRNLTKTRLDFFYIFLLSQKSEYLILFP